MKSEQTIWTTIPQDKREGSITKEKLSGLSLPGAIKPQDLKGVHKPGFHGILISPPDTPGFDKIESEVWKISGLKESDGTSYLTGPALSGLSLFELLNTNTFNEDHLRLLLAALIFLDDPNQPDRGIGTFSKFSAVGTFFTDAGKVLLLPDEILNRVLTLQGRESTRWEEVLSNTSLTGIDNLVFGWSVLAYILHKGSSPFPLEGEEKELYILRGFFEPLEISTPELNQEFTATIHTGLKEPSKVDRRELQTLFINLYSNQSFKTILTEETAALIREGAQKIYRRQQAQYSGKRFFRRKGSLLLVSVVTAGLIIGIIYTILSGVLAPPMTRGWPQEDVVTGFYRAINELDVEIVDDCETNKAGKRRVDMVSNLYAISRIRMGYEMVNPYINAEEWVNTRPDLRLDVGEQLYGIRNLNVQRLTEDSFRVTYEEWTSAYPEGIEPSEEKADPIIIGRAITEELKLVIKRDAWMISELKEIQNLKLDAPH
ncbi:MAG: hypothetical protein JEY99_11160 [Spirochaetales bacterium]|nr:hypothetical protein [Spirochaetales bacterium]